MSQQVSNVIEHIYNTHASFTKSPSYFGKFPHNILWTLYSMNFSPKVPNASVKNIEECRVSSLRLLETPDILNKVATTYWDFS